MKRLSSQQGFTLLEIVIVIAISGLLAAVMSPVVSAFLRVLPWEHAEITAMHDLQQLSHWLTQDGNAALSFTAGTPPDYGTFYGLELAGGGTTRVDVRYFHQGTYMMREVTKNQVLISTERVADNIAEYGDVVFQYTPEDWEYDQFTHLWSYTRAKVVVTVNSTVAADVPRDVIYGTTIEVQLRPQNQREVAMPGNPPEVPPLPGQLDFYVSGEPTILQGSYVSGSGANLRIDDTLYYTVRSASGAPYSLAWEVTSESLPYTSITDLSVEYTGQANNPDVTLCIFVYNPDDPAHVAAGYATAPDYEDQYYVKSVDQTGIFALPDEDVAYVNSLPTKTVKIKVYASRSKDFNLLADKIVFKVSGTLEPGYAVDYQIDTVESPIIVTGTFQSGSGTDLSTDDTLYFAVGSVNVGTTPTVTWDVVTGTITTSISSIEVIWIGQVQRQPTYQQFYVYNLADHGGNGYTSTPDYQATYTAADTDIPMSFTLNASDLNYVSSQVPPVIRLRVKAVRNPGDLAFDLDADKLIFKVTP